MERRILSRIAMNQDSPYEQRCQVGECGGQPRQGAYYGQNARDGSTLIRIAGREVPFGRTRMRGMPRGPRPLRHYTEGS